MAQNVEYINEGAVNNNEVTVEVPEIHSQVQLVEETEKETEDKQCCSCCCPCCTCCCCCRRKVSCSYLDVIN